MKVVLCLYWSSFPCKGDGLASHLEGLNSISQSFPRCTESHVPPVERNDQYAALTTTKSLLHQPTSARDNGEWRRWPCYPYSNIDFSRPVIAKFGRL